MNDTEYLFVVAAVWSIISLLLARLVPNWGGRIALFVVLVGVPFWELPYGYYKFSSLCRDKVALQVFEEMMPQTSICIDYFDVPLYVELVRVGFDRIEITERSDSAKNYLRNDRVVMVKRDEARSSYCIAFKNNIHMPWRMLRSDILVERAGDGRVVARQSDFYWIGMWWQAEATPVLGRGGMCSRKSNEAILAVRHGTK